MLMNESPMSPTDLPTKPARSSKSRHVILWIVVLLVFAGVFTWVVRSQNSPQPAGGGRGMGGGGTVTVIPATVQKGDIGVYQEAIGTVTPVYTSSITSQVTGSIISVHYRE